MPRRSRFAIAAEEWLRENHPTTPISTKDLWFGLSAAYPELTRASERRKTPRATCMRDLRNDVAFVVGSGMIGVRPRH